MTEYWYANRLFFCDVTLKGKQKTAREMMARGFKLDDIAEALNVSLRSIQRWTKDKGSSVPDPTAITDDDPVIADSGTIPIDPVKEQSETTIREKVVAMLQSGLEADTVAQQLGIPLRTLQRLFISSASPEESQKIISNFSTEIQQSFVHAASKDPNEFWVEDAERLLSEHQQSHGQVRRKTYEKLLDQLNSPEPNIRAIHTLSMAMTRHSQAEKESLSLDSLDFNRAMRLIESSGLMVVDPKSIQAIKLQRTQNLSQPQ